MGGAGGGLFRVKHVALIGCLVLLAGVLAQSNRGVQVRGAFQVLIPDKQGRRVAMLSGQGVQGIGVRVPLNTARLDYFGDHGVTNLSIIGTNCIYDSSQQTVTSPGPLRIVTGDDRLAVAGRGFTWWQTNNQLVISNEVTTELRRPPTSTNEVVPLLVRSGLVELQYGSNLVRYSQSVRVEDPSVQLTCSELLVYGVLTGGVQRLVARGQVELINKADGARARCEEAAYRDTSDGEVIELTGRPQWGDGVRSGTAERIVINQTTRRIQAIGEARLAVPVAGADAGGLLGLGFGTKTETVPAATNGIVEVLAGALEIDLPVTNGPVQRIVATTNVVIRDPAQPGGATAQRADYRQPGLLDLTGQPAWTSAGTEVRAELLSFSALDRTAAALTNTVVRLPVARLRERFTSATNTTPGITTNEVVEIRSDYARYLDGKLRFGDQVHATVLAGGERLGELTCRLLDVTYSNRVQAIRAAGNVVVDQFPMRIADGTVVSRRVQGEIFELTLTPEETLESVLAEGNVMARQNERSNPTNQVHKEVFAQRAEVRFGATNQIKSARAAGKVTFSTGARTVTGETATFSDVDGLARLTGNPTAILPEGQISGAEEFIWDSRSGKYRVKGAFRSQWNQVRGLTNMNKLILGQ